MERIKVYGGTITVDTYTEVSDGDSIWLSLSLRQAHVHTFLTKEQARQLIDALIKRVEA